MLRVSTSTKVWLLVSGQIPQACKQSTRKMLDHLPMTNTPSHALADQMKVSDRSQVGNHVTLVGVALFTGLEPQLLVKFVLWLVPELRSEAQLATAFTATFQTPMEGDLDVATNVVKDPWSTVQLQRLHGQVSEHTNKQSMQRAQIALLKVAARGRALVQVSVVTSSDLQK
jgi:hypothetical protein